MTAKDKILVIEDEEKIRRIMKDYLVNAGYEVIEAEDGLSGLYKFECNHVDLIIVDIMMPEIDGWSFCRRVRKKSDVPIIIVSARGDIEDQLQGYELKVDEYIVKPFVPCVMVAKVKSLINRARGTVIKDANVIKRLFLTIDKKARKVTVDNQEIKTTRKEFEILTLLVENEGIVMSRGAILDKIWGYDNDRDYRIVDNHVKKLRKSLGDRAYILSTVFGVGYKVEIE